MELPLAPFRLTRYGMAEAGVVWKILTQFPESGHGLVGTFGLHEGLSQPAAGIGVGQPLDPLFRASNVNIRFQTSFRDRVHRWFSPGIGRRSLGGRGE